MMWMPSGVELVDDLRSARWVEERLWRWPFAHVGSIVPEGFAAYARVFHPAYRQTETNYEAVRWSTVAAWTERIVHPLMQFQRIANLPTAYTQRPWSDHPKEGSLPADECRRLVSVLRTCTASTDRCWFCLWDGYAFQELTYTGQTTKALQFDPARLAVPRLRTPGRTYLLFRGPLDAIESFLQPPWGQSPNLWWPDDRAWCVATEVDLYDTYVGGSKECIKRILGHPDLEALPAALDARVDIGVDTINV